MIRRLALAVVALLALAGCHPFSPDAHRKPTPTPTPVTSSPAPSPGTGGLHVVHTPQTLVDDMHLTPGACHVRKAAGGQPLPDPACTPGAIDPAVTQANIKQTICVRGYTSTVRPGLNLTAPAKRASAAQYGETTGSGEYDHLVPLELGGASATSNLWVQPGPIPNGKDSVENTLNQAVCAGRLTLAQAQQEIAADWTVAK